MADTEVRLTRPYRTARWTRLKKWLPKAWTTIHLVRGGLAVRGIGRARWGVVLYRFTVAGESRDLITPPNVTRFSQMLRKRQRLGPETGAVAAASLELTKLTKLKPLVHHLALLQYHDGEPRQLGKVTFEVKGQMFTAMLTDPDAVAYLRVSAPTFEDLLASVCLLLEQEDAPWEHARWLEQPQKKSRKKG